MMECLEMHVLSLSVWKWTGGILEVDVLCTKLFILTSCTTEIEVQANVPLAKQQLKLC